jgi:uncharacterized protein YndB with AHSA1/START domain
MTTRSVTHATFVVDRTYEAPPEQVFAAWASREAKARWFIGPDEWVSSPHELDFRVGGHERVGGGLAGGPVHTFEATYHDIVPNERIVSTYDMYTDDVRISVSVATVEFVPEESRTRLTYTEHGAFLDGYDLPQNRERGTRELLDSLGNALGRDAGGAKRVASSS